MQEVCNQPHGEHLKPAELFLKESGEQAQLALNVLGQRLERQVNCNSNNVVDVVAVVGVVMVVVVVAASVAILMLILLLTPKC